MAGGVVRNRRGTLDKAPDKKKGKNLGKREARDRCQSFGANADGSWLFRAIFTQVCGAGGTRVDCGYEVEDDAE